MSFMDGLRYRLRVWFSPRAHEQEIDEQVEHHLELEAMQQGKDAHTVSGKHRAAFAARRRFGNVTLAREEARQAAGLALFDSLRQDAQFALRTFGRNKGFTIVTVLTLALGIGANTAIFSAVNTFLLRALPFPDPDQLVSITGTLPARGQFTAADDVRFSFPKFEVFRDAAAPESLFSGLTLWHASQFTVTRGEVTERVDGEFTDRGYFPTLGIAPILGRSFTPDEDTPGGPKAAVLSVRLWDLLFNRSPDVVGQVVLVDGFTYTVVGIAPADFQGLSGAATLFMPIGTQPEGWGRARPYAHNYHLVGRLADGVSQERARALIPELGRRVDAAYPHPSLPDVHQGVAVKPLDSARVDARMRRTVLVLFGAVGLVLMIACANVANLFLVRASGRRREIAVRLAIGAGRKRLVRQLLAESVLLSLMGGAASLAVAWIGVRGLDSLQMATVLRANNIAGLGTVHSDSIRLDPMALTFTAILAIVTGIIFGLVPALQATKPSLTEALKDDGSAPATGRRRLTSRNVLVVAEIAVAVVLLAGAGLTIRSLGELLGVRPGFDGEHVLTMRVNRAPAWSRDSISRFYDVAIERLTALPGVTGAAMIDCPPLAACQGEQVMRLDRPSPAPDERQVALVHFITPGWPELMGVPLLRGRMLDSGDRPNTPPVVLISAAAAQRLYPGEDPIGKQLTTSSNRTDTVTVAGVIGDVHYESLDRQPLPDLYASYYQRPMSFRMMIFVRTVGDPAAFINPVRAALNEVAPGFPVYDVLTMNDRVAAATAYARFSALLLTMFASLALGLATLGTYGVISYAVAQRRQEIGIRIALGASRGDVLKLVIGQGIAMAAAGSALGLAVAFAATRVLASLLYNVAPTDPLTLVSIVLVLVLAVIAASWVPARRAAKVPAMLAMRAG